MTTRESVEKGVMAWLRAANGGLTEYQVIPAKDDGDRPALPYLTVRASVLGVRVGNDADVDDIDGSGFPRRRTRGLRRGTVQIRGYGDGAEAWIEEAVLQLRAEALKTLIGDTHKLTIEPLGDLRDLTALRDTGFEPQFLQEVQVHYLLDSDTETATELVLVEAAVTYDGNAPTDITETVSVDLS